MYLVLKVEFFSPSLFHITVLLIDSPDKIISLYESIGTLSIAHGDRSDILLHCRTQLHKKSVSVTATTQPSNQHAAGGQQSILSYGYKSKEEDKATIRAECLFAAFYVEHNIPLAVADHMNQLLRSAFPNSEWENQNILSH